MVFVIIDIQSRAIARSCFFFLTASYFQHAQTLSRGGGWSNLTQPQENSKFYSFKNLHAAYMYMFSKLSNRPPPKKIKRYTCKNNYMYV